MTPINTSSPSLFSRAGTAVTNAFVQRSVQLNKIETGHWEVAKAIAYPATRLATWVMHTALAKGFQASNPKSLMAQTNTLAEQGLKVAAAKGISIDPPRQLIVQSQLPEIDNTDWHAKIDAATKGLAQKLSAFTTLLQMREWAGIRNVSETDKLDLMELAQKATTGTKPSVWKLFKDKYHPSFFQTLKAGFFYLLFYPHLLGSTIDTYLQGFISVVKRKLTAENDQTRNQVFKQLISDLHVFLLGRYSATEAFSKGESRISPDGKVHRTLEELRNYNVEEQYRFDLKPLCAFFSEAMIEASSVTVPLVSSTLRNIPLLGWILRKFESFLNHFIIRKVIQSVLPGVLEGTVNNGIALSKPSNLPFSIALATFLRECLEDLITKPSSSENETKPIPGTETLLPDTLGELQILIRLAPYTGMIELGQKIQELRKAKPGFFDSFDNDAEKAVKNAITNACHLLFRNLNDSARSGKLFADLLENSSAIFAKGERNPDILKQTFERELADINRLGGEAFRKILNSKVPQEIDSTVDSKLPTFMRGTPRNIRTATDALFDQHRLAAELALKTIHNQVQTIRGKINNLNSSQTVHAEIAKILQSIRDLTYRNKEDKKPDITDPLAELSFIDRDALWRQLSLLYQDLEELMAKHLLSLQARQEQYSSYASIEQTFAEIQTVKANRSGKWVEQLIKLLNTIPLQSGPADLQQKTRALQTIAPDLAKHLRAATTIDAISQHLQKIYAYEQNKHPWGYRPKTSLAKIHQILGQSDLSDTDTKALQTLIGTGSKLLSKQSSLTILIAKLKQDSTQEQTRLIDCVSTELSDPWMTNAIQACRAKKDAAHQEMQTTATALSAESQALLLNIQSQKSPLSPSLTATREKSIAFAASVIPSVIPNAPAAALVGTVFSFMSHFIWSKPTEAVDLQEVDAKLPKDPKERVAKMASDTFYAKLGIGAKFVGLLTAPAISSSPGSIWNWAPKTIEPLGTLVNSGVAMVAGGLARNQAYSYIQDTIVAPKVQELFHGLLDLLWAPDGHLYKSTVASMLKSGGHGLKKLASETNA